MKTPQMRMKLLLRKPKKVFKKTNDDTSDSLAGGDITVPGISENDENGKTNEDTSRRGGKYNLRPNTNPNYTDECRY